jgi:uracil-DNA glycosylase family 4
MADVSTKLTDENLTTGDFHNCYFEGVIGTGPKPCDVFIVGIAPGRHEWMRSKQPFTGPSGKLLDATLKAIGWSREKCFLTNLYCQWEDEPTEEEIALCASRFQAEVEEANPKLVILLGGIAGKHFLKSYKRGRLYWQEFYGAKRWIMVTNHPAAYLRGDSAFKVDIADFARDLGKIPLVTSWEADHADKIANPVYRVVETAEEAHSVLWSLVGLTAIDIESSYDGLEFVYPDDGLVGTDDSKLLCFSVSNERGTWTIPGWFIKDIRPGWGSRDQVEWCMQGGLFDMATLRRLLGEELKLAEDTLLQDYSLDERGGDNEENDIPVGIHGLKSISNEFLGAPDYDINVLRAEPDELHE